MRIHVKVTDTGEEAVFSEGQEEAEKRFIGNSVATLAKSHKGEKGWEGPTVVIRWIPDPEHWTLWVCTNCIMHHANGECGDCHREEGHEGGEPLSLLSNHVTMGMVTEEHSEDCRVRITGESTDNEECDCDRTTFSRSQCGGCGSDYHGERHAMTEWSE